MLGLDHYANQTGNTNAFAQSDLPSELFINQKEIGFGFFGKHDGLSLAQIQFRLQPSDELAIQNLPDLKKFRDADMCP